MVKLELDDSFGIEMAVILRYARTYIACYTNMLKMSLKKSEIMTPCITSLNTDSYIVVESTHRK